MNVFTCLSLQGLSDQNSDFRVMDASDGTLCLQSVGHLGTFLALESPSGEIMSNFSVFSCVRGSLRTSKRDTEVYFCLLVLSWKCPKACIKHYTRNSAEINDVEGLETGQRTWTNSLDFVQAGGFAFGLIHVTPVYSFLEALRGISFHNDTEGFCTD